MMILRTLDAAEVKSQLESQQSHGCRISDRLHKEVDSPGERILVKAPTANEFLTLLWQSDSNTRLLAPDRNPRTVRDCAKRLANFGWRFQNLVSESNNWFQRCADIDENFDYAKLGWIVLTPLIPNERRETPDATFYIFEGVHRSIVLAKRLLREEEKYKPLDFLLLCPRRN